MPVAPDGVALAQQPAGLVLTGQPPAETGRAVVDQLPPSPLPHSASDS